MFCKLVLPSNEVYKMSSLPNSFEELQEVITKKLSDRVPKSFQLKYQDSDKEFITIANTEDLKTAIATTESENQKTLRISIVPTPEPTHYIKQNIKFDPLPGIPETMERSMSSLAEVSRTPSGLNEPIKQVEEPLKSSYMKFDLDKIPRTQSLILDDEETFDETTSGPENHESASKHRKFFNFSRADSIEISKSQLEKSLSSQSGHFLNEQKIKVIEDLIEAKITQTLQERIQNIIHDLALKFQEECNLITPAKTPPPYQCGLFPTRAINRPSARRHTIQTPKGYTYKGPICACCNKTITGIKYFCLTCPDYACCEDCEETANHFHPLLKIRPAKKRDENSENIPPEQDDLQSNYLDLGNPNPFVNRKFTRRSTVSSRLMSMNSAVNLPDITDQMDNYNNILCGNDFSPMASSSMIARRGFSMGNSFSGASLQSKLGRNCTENDSRYKACITRQSASEAINMKPGSSQNIELTVRNVGDSKWQDPVKLICINGIYKENEIDVPNLEQGEEVKLTLPLIAPSQLGRYLSQWKLHYFESGFPKQFGKAIFIDIEVSEKERPFDEEPLEESEENEERYELHGDRAKELGKKQEKPSLSGVDSLEPDKALMKEMECCEETLNRAKTLNDMFPGDIKEKIEFIRSFPKSRSINDIVSSYLAKMSTGTKRRMTWANNQRISTHS